MRPNLKLILISNWFRLRTINIRTKSGIFHRVAREASRKKHDFKVLKLLFGVIKEQISMITISYLIKLPVL